MYALHAADHGMAGPGHAERGECAGSVSAGGFGRGASSPAGAADGAESFGRGPSVRRVR